VSRALEVFETQSFAVLKGPFYARFPKTMRAMVLKRHGGLEALEFEPNWLVPVPTGREVLIKVAATGMNNTDVTTRSG